MHWAIVRIKMGTHTRYSVSFPDDPKDWEIFINFLSRTGYEDRQIINMWDKGYHWNFIYYILCISINKKLYVIDKQFDSEGTYDYILIPYSDHRHQGPPDTEISILFDTDGRPPITTLPQPGLFDSPNRLADAAQQVVINGIKIPLDFAKKSRILSDMLEKRNQQSGDIILEYLNLGQNIDLSLLPSLMKIDSSKKIVISDVVNIAKMSCGESVPSSESSRAGSILWERAKQQFGGHLENELNLAIALGMDNIVDSILSGNIYLLSKHIQDRDILKRFINNFDNPYDLFVEKDGARININLSVILFFEKHLEWMSAFEKTQRIIFKVQIKSLYKYEMLKIPWTIQRIESKDYLQHSISFEYQPEKNEEESNYLSRNGYYGLKDTFSSLYELITSGQVYVCINQRLYGIKCEEDDYYYDGSNYRLVPRSSCSYPYMYIIQTATRHYYDLT